MKYLNFLPLLLLGISSVALCADSAVDPKSIQKILFLGDSITHHEPTPSLEWSGNWGMAASSEDKDYVHLFLAKLNQARGSGGPAPDVNILAEGGGKITDKLASIGKITAYQADLAVIQLGENDKILTEEGFQQPYEQILQAVQAGNPKARILCTGVWGVYPGGDQTKNNFIRAACQKYGATFVDLGAAFTDPANRASSQHSYPNPGVGWHPGDGGMAAYADALWQAFTGAPVAEASTPSPAPVPGASPAPPVAGAPAAAPAGSAPAAEVDETWSNPPSQNWVPMPATVQEDGNNVAKITVTPGQPSMFALPLDVSQFAGRVVEIKTRIKADSISEPPKPWNGVKIMLRVKDAEGKLDFPQYRLQGGTYDWKDIDWKVRVPENTTYLEFDIGLEKVTGTAYFGAIRLSAGQ